MSSWRNRIIGHGEEAPDQLLANPRNWRIHPRSQQKALGSVLDTVGWVQDVIVNQRTGFVVDGHLRVSLAISRGESAVPVVYVDLDEAEERLVLASLDPLSGMAVADPEVLGDLLRGISIPSDELAAVLDALAPRKAAEDWETIEEVPSELAGVAALKYEASWDDGLPWDMPALRVDRLASIPKGGFQSWAGPDTEDSGLWWLYQWRSDSIRGLEWARTCVSFYVDDARFESFWEDPAGSVGKLLNLGCSMAITPNYSLWHGQGRALHLYATYKSRWVGRYLQEAGIPVIPDVNWSDQRSFDFCLVGIPEGAPAISVQLQTLNTAEERNRATRGLETVLERLRPQSLLVYGHRTAREVVDAVGPDCPVVHCESRTVARRVAMAARETGKGV